jgi:hypothetical protein
MACRSGHPERVSEDEALELYFKDVRSLPRIDRAVIADLLQRTRSGDGEAETELARGLLELTAVLTRHLAPPTMRTLDAIQEANLVLMALLQDRSVASPVHALPGALSRRFAHLEEDDEA